ncbi:hypothetical protein [Vallitalea maricola]|uniref:Uncharacterized protein n=1 Tax=Vallitalea maricola TaxID=3074433 RepID=A0ACB5UF79_9FIRM|nr:hypothetical protein AN2V17_04060 [Vallitalea sp. AN17-2]
MEVKYICMPLASNVPQPGSKDWILTKCPSCGEKCWEIPLGRQIKEQQKDSNDCYYMFVCTKCALKNIQQMQKVLKDKCKEKDCKKCILESYTDYKDIEKVIQDGQRLKVVGFLSDIPDYEIRVIYKDKRILCINEKACDYLCNVICDQIIELINDDKKG